MNFNEMKGKDLWNNLAETDADRKDYNKIWEATGQYKNNFEPDLESGLSAFQAKLAAEKSTSAKIIQLSPMRKLMRIAAVAIILVAAGFVFNQFSNNTDLLVLESETQKVEAFELADGSKVWLNENSTLAYPENFEANERRVILSGEGYFEITKNPNAPFIVETQNSEVKVLGTSFNVRCVKGEAFDEVQVATGKVNFGAKTEDKKFDLVANERATFNMKDKSLTKDKDSNLNALAWKTNRLKFENTPISEVIEKLSRFYKIECNIDKLVISDCPFSGQYEDVKKEEIFEVLKAALSLEIKNTSATEFEISGGICPK